MRSSVVIPVWSCVALIGSWCVATPALAQPWSCYAKGSGPASRTPIDTSYWNCFGETDTCCLLGRVDDVDDDGDGIPARCDPDDGDPDDDDDGLPTVLEDLDGDGNWFDDTDRRSPTGVTSPAFLDPRTPLDDDSDGYCDCSWAADVPAPPAFCASFDDCTDYLADAHPGAPEVADAEEWDHDCLGPNDYDIDGDGFQNQSWVDSGGDCVDTSSEISPDAVEDYGGIDRDCDGFTDPAGGLDPNRGCGCSTPAPVAPWLVALALPLAWRRRRA